jgi:hypothetical protein
VSLDTQQLGVTTLLCAREHGLSDGTFIEPGLEVWGYDRCPDAFTGMMAFGNVVEEADGH